MFSVSLIFIVGDLCLAEVADVYTVLAVGKIMTYVAFEWYKLYWTGDQ